MEVVAYIFVCELLHLIIKDLLLINILNKAKKMLETLNSPEKARNTSASKTANTSIKNESNDLNGLLTPGEQEDNQD